MGQGSVSGFGANVYLRQAGGRSAASQGQSPTFGEAGSTLPQQKETGNRKSERKERPSPERREGRRWTILLPPPISDRLHHDSAQQWADEKADTPRAAPAKYSGRENPCAESPASRADNQPSGTSKLEASRPPPPESVRQALAAQFENHLADDLETKLQKEIKKKLDETLHAQVTLPVPVLIFAVKILKCVTARPDPRLSSSSLEKGFGSPLRPKQKLIKYGDLALV